MTVRVQTQDFDIGAELEKLSAGNHQVGGVASFVGLVRDIAPEGSGASSSMTLEHYPGMTEKRLAEIESEAQRRWPLAATLIIHRYGRLEPGHDATGRADAAQIGARGHSPAAAARTAALG